MASKKRSPLLYIGLGFVAIVLLSVGYGVYEARRASAVWPDAQTLAIEIPASPLPADSGGYSTMLAAIKEVDGQEQALVLTLLETQGPPTAGLQEWQDNPKVTQAMDRVLQHRGIHAPVWSMAEETPKLMPLLYMARVRLLRGWSQLLPKPGHEVGEQPEQRQEAALGDMRDTLRLGIMLEHSGGNLLMVMVGVAVQKQAMTEIVELLDSRPQLPRQSLQQLRDLLQQTLTYPSGIVAGVAGECVASERMVEGFRHLSTAELMRNTGDMEFGSAKEQAEAPSGGGSWFFNVDKTVRMARYECAKKLNRLRQPGYQRKPLEPMVELWQSGSLAPGQYLDNPIGRLLLQLAHTDFSQFGWRIDEHRARRSVLVARLGLSLYRLDKATVAATLQDLVPDYLASVPSDPHDGKPLKYNGQQLWSLVAERDDVSDVEGLRLQLTP